MSNMRIKREDMEPPKRDAMRELCGVIPGLHMGMSMQGAAEAILTEVERLRRSIDQANSGDSEGTDGGAA